MANLNDEKLKMMEDEMNRFEAEIALPVHPPPPPPNISATSPATPRPVIGSNTYNQVQRRLEEQQTVLSPEFAGAPMGFQPGVMPPVPFGGIPPPPPPPPPLLIPHQVQRVPPRHPPPPPPTFLRGPPPPLRAVAPTAPPAGPFVGTPTLQNALDTTTVPPQAPPPAQNVPTVLSATPKIYVSKPSGKSPTEINMLNRLEDEAAERKKKLKKLGLDKTDNTIDSASLWGAREMAERVRASTVVTTIGPDPSSITTPSSRKKDKKPKKHVRTAGGQTWEDSSLTEWDEDDFRIFCGDLGNDVTDEILTRAFSKYSSFMRAKVVRDKRTNKTKGFGFVSFKDPQDFIKAMKEMNGRYVGSRPIKLRKSTWKSRNLDSVRRKEKEKAALVGLLLGQR